MNFRNGKLVCNPLARLARPVGDSGDLYAILLFESRNVEGYSVAAGSDRLTRIFSDMKRLTFLWRAY
jgi:hypothetical protein